MESELFLILIFRATDIRRTQAEKHRRPEFIKEAELTANSMALVLEVDN